MGTFRIWAPSSYGHLVTAVDMARFFCSHSFHPPASTAGAAPAAAADDDDDDASRVVVVALLVAGAGC